MAVMEWAERTYEGPDGKSYATLIHGGAMSLELRELTVEHLFTPFQVDGENKTASRDYCTLSGMGFLREQLIHVVGVQEATTTELPVSITGYDEEAPKGGAGWTDRARRGWPCNLGMFFDEKRDVYRWFCRAYISASFFDKLLALHHSERLCSLRLNLRVDIFVEAIRRYLPDPVSDFYLVAEKGDTKFSSTALGFVEDIDVVETTVNLQPWDSIPDDQAPISHDDGSDKDQDKRVEALERELAELKSAVDELRQRPRRNR
jgi:hypothetical protein